MASPISMTWSLSKSWELVMDRRFEVLQSMASQSVRHDSETELTGQGPGREYLGVGGNVHLTCHTISGRALQSVISRPIFVALMGSPPKHTAPNSASSSFSD